MQKYIAKIHKIDGLKYDLRIYVLLCGVNPLRVYVYKDGLARFATVPYAGPNKENMANLNMHLTNYAINKLHEDFEQNEDQDKDDVGHKRSMKSVFYGIEEDMSENEMKSLIAQIYDIIIKSLCLAQPHVAHLMKSC